MAPTTALLPTPVVRTGDTPARAAGAAQRSTTRTHCPYCSLQCGILLTAGGRPATLEPDPDFPTNRGGLCSKGWTAHELLDHPERLLTPLVRAVPGDRTSPLVPASWEEALDRVTAAITGTQARHGRDAVGVFGGGGLTNEKAYALGKFARVALRTSAIDYNGRFCMSSAAAAMNRVFGVDRGLPFPLADLAAADAIMITGGNPAATMPPAMQHFDAARARGASLVVVDPRRTPTAAAAAAQGVHLAPVPGTDLPLLLGMLHVAVRDGFVDREYVDTRTTGFDAAAAAAAQWWPDRVERTTGVPEGDLRRAVRLMAAASPTRGGAGAIMLSGRGAEQHANGTDTVLAQANLALALGLPGSPGSGFGTVTGQGNGQGGREHGLKADQLPGYRSISDPAARAHVAGVWGVDPDALPGPGRSAYEMIDALGSAGGVRALLLLASNPVVSAPDAERVRRRLAALDHLVVVDFFLSETAALADVVLPTAQWAEEAGTMTNVEGRVILRRRALAPPDGVRDDLELLNALAHRLDLPAGLDADAAFPTEPEAVFTELRRASAGGRADYSGITYERLEAEQGVFWPCPSLEGQDDDGEQHPGTPRLFADAFPTHDGRAQCAVVRYTPRAERTSAGEFPYVLTTGRTMAQYQSGAQTRRVRQLVMTDPDARAELHPDLARRHGVADGDLVRLTTRRGTALFRARVTKDVVTGTVFVPFHWGGMSVANALTDTRLDPVSRMPEFKACAVRLERHDPHDPHGADGADIDSVDLTREPDRHPTTGEAR
ncbi:molybdopterin oxidoreductase family protein [Quadrisphaera setariae]|uniref:molybdopterin oxidoreductase family protein n=1 Tax=Quadrisphaera setariae TaxID=2593304 RepID=UPI001C9D0412|nr:molybdopterin oxidoreductase family protein [Quadrisphaera setariae]